MEVAPCARFAVEKVVGVSRDGNYLVQYAPTWVSKFHLVGCEHLIEEYLQQQQQEQQQQQQQQKLQPQQQQQQQDQEKPDEQQQQQNVIGTTTLVIGRDDSVTAGTILRLNGEADTTSLVGFRLATPL